MRVLGRQGSRPTGRQALRRLAGVAWVAVIALLAIRLLPGVQPVDAGATVQAGAGGSSVTDVRVGSLAWFLGIAPGDAYIPSPDGGGGLVPGPVRDVELPETLPPLPWWPVAAAVVALVAAFVVRRAAPSLAVVVMVAAAALLAWDLPWVVVMPLAPMVIVVPTLVLGIHWLVAAPHGRRRSWLGIALVVAIGVEAVALATATRDTWRPVWAGATLIPLLLAIGTATIAWAVAIRRSLGASDATSRSVANAMVESTTAGRAALWGASERSRDERAQWVHDTVLPQLSMAAREADAGHGASGSQVLRRLAEDLRAGLEQEQLTVLRAGGMRAALDDALQEARAEGFACDLSVDARGDGPPWPVVVAAWRVAQEAIANARQHSGGDRIGVALEMRDDRLALEVSDDGVGLEQGALARRRGHIGMQAMARAAEAVGAAVRFLPAMPSGLTVRFEWPT